MLANEDNFCEIKEIEVNDFRSTFPTFQKTNEQSYYADWVILPILVTLEVIEGLLRDIWRLYVL